MVKRLQIVIVILILVLAGYWVFQYVTEKEPETAQSESEIISEETKENKVLPVRYDTREEGKAPTVKNQGQLGTCWAVASSSALETALRPMEEWDFSADHISMSNHFDKEQNDGGDYTMAMAYLAGWQGPVKEEDDPYGDGQTNSQLQTVKHVQEIQMLQGQDITALKEAVYQNGSVQSALYMDMEFVGGSSLFYNDIHNSYCYPGSEQANHDILIIGWDDDFPAARFNAEVGRNGAFICQNSWGTEFGEQGIFYVSYEDTNLGKNGITYSEIEETDNYSAMYQTDLCGWVGQIGYGEENCYFANVFEAEQQENLKAVGFYATGKNTSYELYVVENFKGTSSLLPWKPVQEGSFQNPGYYTVDLEESVELKAGQRFAIMIKITTPEVEYPVATEYIADEATASVVLSDGEGYISLNGMSWTSTEEVHDCNVCLKAYLERP